MTIGTGGAYCDTCGRSISNPHRAPRREFDAWLRKHGYTVGKWRVTCPACKAKKKENRK